jgi:hypothetical protein
MIRGAGDVDDGGGVDTVGDAMAGPTSVNASGWLGEPQQAASPGKARGPQVLRGCPFATGSKNIEFCGSIA